MNDSQEPTSKTPQNPTHPKPLRSEDAPKSLKAEASDRTTVIAFGLLFVLPAVIIVFAVLFFLPYMLNTLANDPSGVTATAPNVMPPSRK